MEGQNERCVVQKCMYSVRMQNQSGALRETKDTA